MGKPRLKKVKELPLPRGTVDWKDRKGNTHTKSAYLTIPQPDGSSALIPTLEVDNLSKGLGVHFTPLGDGAEHLTAMQEKGLDWAAKIRICPLARWDVEMSFFLMLMQTSQGATGRVRILAAQSKPLSFIAVRCSVPSPKGVKCTPRPLEGSSTSNVGMRAELPSG